MGIKVTCNNVPRHLSALNELPEADRQNFDYIDGPEVWTPRLVRYRGEWYDTGDMMLTPSDLARLGFDGYATATPFSGVVVRCFDRDGYLIDGGDSVVVGYYYSD